MTTLPVTETATDIDQSIPSIDNITIPAKQTMNNINPLNINIIALLFCLLITL